MQGFDGIVADHRGELLNHLQHQRIALDRGFRLALALGTTARGGLGRGLLLGFANLDIDRQGAPQVLIQSVVDAPLLGRVEQRAVGRIQMQGPDIAVARHQRAVGGDAAGHATQAQLAEEVVEGTAGGGVVTARVKGDQTVESVSIDPDALDPDDVEMLGDLVTAAVNEGLRKAKDLAADRLGGITQGMGLPPGLGI